MDCQQARNLFDSYLDGELSGTLATELDAHRLQCPTCRQELALLEVAGHVIAVEPEPGEGLSEDFPDRLLACVEPRSIKPATRLRRPMVIGASLLALAASVVLVVALIRSPTPKVAGEKIFRNTAEAPEKVPEPTLDVAAESLRKQVETTWSARRRSANALFQFGQDLLTDMLEQLDPDREVRFDLPRKAAPDSDDGELPDDEYPSDVSNDDLEDL